ncbi:nucleotidyltransferase domain-containing protein [Radiobacillus sp. PE A8.2]|uniref:nucleotidyltransferase domain-containing protein n=1 Tax=Radiobacillus sp. PE A8.2 TaxID=3380349 RepID=UPI0038904A2A
MVQEEAVEQIVASLTRDNLVQAIFLKGSMGRGEHDQYSDVDLYCLVEEQDKQSFLKNRLEHLRAYRALLFYDDIFIIAPQIIAVFDNMVHVDLFTVTEDTYVEKDYIKVLFDPNHLLDKYKETQHLTLSSAEFQDDVNDVSWFLFQYKKSADRGNDLWSVSMLHHAMIHVARVLLHRYKPERAQLGLKALETSLSEEILVRINNILQFLTPNNHKKGVMLICALMANETEWILSNLENRESTAAFLETMIHKTF